VKRIPSLPNRSNAPGDSPQQRRSLAVRVLGNATDSNSGLLSRFLNSLRTRIRLLKLGTDTENAVTMHESDLIAWRSGGALRMLFAVHVSRDANTAVYKNTRERVAYLEDQGCECTILAPQDFPWTQRLGARFTPLFYPIALAFWLARRAKSYEVTTFHSYAGWAVLLLGRFLHRFKNLRTVIQFHGLEPLYFSRLDAHLARQKRPLSWRYRFVHGRLMFHLLRRSCRAADMVLCLNSEELRYLVEHQWCERSRVHLVANPAPDSFYLQRQHRERATHLLFVGQWLGMKGTQYLTSAFARLRNEFPHLRLLCAGTMTNVDSVLKDFPADIRDYVEVFPRVTKSGLLELYRQADLFVFPTLSEGFSLALIEAMASGLPIVTTPVGAAPDILCDGESAVFCPPDDTDALVEAISALVNDRQRRERLGQNAQRAAEPYHPQEVWRDYAVCLNRLAGRNSNHSTREPLASAVEDNRVSAD
jgi:glycosyltransferase involved in cell wall biosynthesis